MTSQTDDHIEGAPMNEGFRIAVIVLGVILVISGIFGNGLLMVVLWRSKVREFPKVFIANLALADLVVICCLPFTVLELILGWLPISSFHCRMNAGILSTGYNVSIMCLIVVSCNRYVKVCHPTSFRRIFSTRRNLIICAALWSFAILTNIPAFFPSVASYGFDPNAHTCNARGDSTDLNYGSMAMISLLIAPVISITYFNVAIYKRWHGSQQRMKKTAKKTKATKIQKGKPKTEASPMKNVEINATAGRERGGDLNKKEDANEQAKMNENGDVESTANSQLEMNHSISHTDTKTPTTSRSGDIEDKRLDNTPPQSSGREEVKKRVVSEQTLNGSSSPPNKSKSESVVSIVDETETKKNQLTLPASTPSTEGDSASEDYAKEALRSSQVSLDFERTFVEEAGRTNVYASTSTVLTDVSPATMPQSDRVLNKTDGNHAVEAEISSSHDTPSNKLRDPPTNNTRDPSSNKRGKTTAAVHKKARAELALVRSLLVISISLFIFYTPFNIALVLSLFIEDPVPVEFSVISALFLFANCANNWVIYGAMNTMFREAYIDVLKSACCCCRLR